MKFLIWLSHDCTSLAEVVTALQSGGNEVGILLVQDGVYLADKGCTHSDELKGFNVPVYASKSHIEERGINDRLVLEVKIMDYSEIVDLMMEHYDRIISM
ncbi:MAG: sulfurtransferase complex subunit TusB [Candidatus Thorarchaeota archaeon]